MNVNHNNSFWQYTSPRNVNQAMQLYLKSTSTSRTTHRQYVEHLKETTSKKIIKIFANQRWSPGWLVNITPPFLFIIYINYCALARQAGNCQFINIITTIKIIVLINMRRTYDITHLALPFLKVAARPGRRTCFVWTTFGRDKRVLEQVLLGWLDK